MPVNITSPTVNQVLNSINQAGNLSIVVSGSAEVDPDSHLAISQVVHIVSEVRVLLNGVAAGSASLVDKGLNGNLHNYAWTLPCNQQVTGPLTITAEAT